MADEKPLTGKQQKIAAFICREISSGKSVREISKKHKNVSWSKIRRWRNQSSAFRSQYARATEDRANVLFEEILEIADDGRSDTYKDENGCERTDHEHIQRSALRVDVRKWQLSKMVPKVYGNKVDVTSRGEKLPPFTGFTLADLKPDDE